ncbi:MAG: phosphoenolpyruvate--protein phosphotransferase [Acidobacteria bacterium]|nr:MAG: phosphoenolpyruvate--protein phosphotransferase [Acidobacteriota bacterium]
MKENHEAPRRLRGLGVSPGIGIGTIVHLSSRGPHVFRMRIAPHQVEEELRRLAMAFDKARQQLAQMKAKLEQALGRDHAYILDAHLLMLEDQQLIEDITSIIRTQQVNAEWAIKVVMDRILAIYADVKDDYLRERGSDIEDVAHRLITTLQGDHRHRWLLPETILATEQMLPSMMIELDPDAVVGLVARTGGWTSHAAIIARGLGIPAVVGIEGLHEEMAAGMLAIVDGHAGELILNPTEDLIAQYRERQAESERLWCAVRDRVRLPTVTRDGTPITLRANIELPSEVDAIEQYGAQGVGLFRTQYLFLSSHTMPPSEHVQFATYRRLAEACGQDGVTIRTLDWAESESAADDAEPETNPALGLRAIRYSLQAPELFRIQLRAILRAAFYGRIRVVLPLVSSVTEIRRARELLQAVARELDEEDLPHQADIPVGVMIEVPAAVFIADALAAEADFFSLGTNDLIQYLLAVDRDDSRVAHLYRPLHPAVLCAVKKTVEAAAAAHIPVEVCGEMAAEPLHALALIGLGVRRLSMAPKAIPLMKDVIRSVDLALLEDAVERALKLVTAEDVERLLQEEWADVLSERYLTNYTTAEGG